MAYTEVHIVTTDNTIAEIFMAELAEIGFDTFEEVDTGLKAYIEETDFNASVFEELISRYKPMFDFEVESQSVEKENWNKKWEENYDPIVVDERCIVRATFHQIEQSYPIEIIVNPQMSFGTGHHATTWQMLKLQIDTDFKGKKVLDLGSGTGVLAIMAAKLGATTVEATDIDEWCIANSQENFALNGLEGIKVQQGAVADLQFDDPYDILLANINKNVLLAEMPHYSELLATGGKLFLSGFYEADIDDILASAGQYKLEKVRASSKNDWAALVLVKK